MKRRTFIKSTLGSAVFALGGVAAFQYYQQSKLSFSVEAPTRYLNLDDQLLLSVLIPVFAGELANQPKIQQVIINIDSAIVRLPEGTQVELRELFDLLTSAMGRLLLAGVWLNWQRASRQDLDVFLTGWRESSLSLLQQGYLGLHQLISGSVYAESDTWGESGYPGPPKIR